MVVAMASLTVIVSGITTGLVGATGGNCCTRRGFFFHSLLLLWLASVFTLGLWLWLDGIVSAQVGPSASMERSGNSQPCGPNAPPGGASCPRQGDDDQHGSIWATSLLIALPVGYCVQFPLYIALKWYCWKPNLEENISVRSYVARIVEESGEDAYQVVLNLFLVPPEEDEKEKTEANVDGLNGVTPEGQENAGGNGTGERPRADPMGLGEEATDAAIGSLGRYGAATAGVVLVAAAGGAAAGGGVP